MVFLFSSRRKETNISCPESVSLTSEKKSENVEAFYKAMKFYSETCRDNNDFFAFRWWFALCTENIARI